MLLLCILLPCNILILEQFVVFVQPTLIQDAKEKLEEEDLEKINVTDNDAKIMKHKDGSKKPSYNSQIAVDDKEQVIVAADLVDEQNDVNQVKPMKQFILQL
jgi:hypothetical protein